ncbi:hypothetical protein FIU86_08850 [Roseovarius sp. THAF9]|uniref:hypothetical protein n=1 Tax=Roseovarius sp. THAF9 TaxID=2587847 RepID=UPI00126935C4|nr:hypothetical protein [Roseovarius sp. THAF9]QFT92950.1 hypothetical protein FIU86_08850 [Roseovarius sp. THAF9]
MMDTDHKKWTDILSFGAPTQPQQDDTPETLAIQQDEDPTASLILPAVQSVRLSSAGGEDFDFHDFKAAEPTDETAYELSDILISSYQTGGSGDGIDMAPEPEPVSDFTTADHFDFF